MDLLIVLAGQQNHDDCTGHLESDLKCTCMMKAMGRKHINILFYFHCLSSSVRKVFYTESNSQAAEGNKLPSFNWSAAKKTDFDNALEVNLMVLSRAAKARSRLSPCGTKLVMCRNFRPRFP